jgi:hypothetical protein
MKYKMLLTLSVGLSCFFCPQAQINNNPRRSSTDTLELLAFRRLITFISTNDLNAKNDEKGSDTVPHFGEQHMLVEAVARGAAREATENSSWDKSMPTVYHKEPTVGSPFLLHSYTRGLVINQLDSVIDKPDYLFNYDKMSGNLLLKRDNDLPIAVNKAQVKYFCLKRSKGGYIFERVPLINSGEFFQVLLKGLKYSCYKMYRSKFVPMNQHTNGYVTEGNDYDEYQDFYTYFLLDQKKEEVVVFELTKKSIRKTFPSKNAIVEKYIKDHRNDDMDEIYITGLVEKLNE